MNLNKAIVCGRLTNAPENRTLPSGKTVSNFSVATNRIWVDEAGEKQEQAEFHNIVAFGKLAEICNKYLTKGQMILIEGRIQTRSWEGKDGNNRYRTEIVASNMQMGPRPGESSSPRNFASTAEETKFQAKNKNQSESKQKNKDKKSMSERKKGGGEIKVEDIPF